MLASDVFFPVLGYLIGKVSNHRIPVIVGLPSTSTEDQLKALGAAAASSGAVALFHAVGVTPEAATLEAALHGEPALEKRRIGLSELVWARDELSTVPDGPIAAVALGSPHFSLAEFEGLIPLIERWSPAESVEVVVCTQRLVLEVLEQRGWAARLRAVGVRLVVDTCVVVTPILRTVTGSLMTNSGKFAHYAPSKTGLPVVYGSLEECVRSAALGAVWRDPELWR